MNSLFKSKHYSWSLFIGHLVIEKLLKACYLKNVEKEPPYIHNLLKIAERAGLELSEGEKDRLQTITIFNIGARYSDEKYRFQRKCTRSYTEKWIREIKSLRVWIKEKLLV